MNAVKIVLAGLAGWVMRLGFAASLAIAAYGIYVAWYASLGEPNPDHDRGSGSVLTGLAVGASIVFLIALRSAPSVRGTTRGAWYGFAYFAFFSLFLTALAFSAGFRLIGDWERSTLSVPATVSACYQAADSSAVRTQDYCDYSWDLAGVHHTQTRTSDAVYDDGTQVGLWVDPHTGGAADHELGYVILSFVGAAVCLFLNGVVVVVGGLVSDDSIGPRRWFARLAWWRELRIRPRPEGRRAVAARVPAPGARNAAGEPEDARPGVPLEVTDAVERAHAHEYAHGEVTLPLHRGRSRSRGAVCTRLGCVVAFCAAVLVPIVFLGWAYGQVVLIVVVAVTICFGELVGLLVSAFVRGSKGPDTLEVSPSRLRVLTSTWHGPEVMRECDRDRAVEVELRDGSLTIRDRSGSVLSRALTRRRAHRFGESLARYGWLVHETEHSTEESR